MYKDNPVFSFHIINSIFFETLPKHNGAAFISESLALNLYISAPLTNIQPFFPL